MINITAKGDCEMVMVEPTNKIESSGDLKATIKSPSFVLFERNNKIKESKQSNYQDCIKRDLFVINLVTDIISESESEVRSEFYQDYYVNNLAENVVNVDIQNILDDIIILPEIDLHKSSLSLEISATNETLDLINNSMGSINLDDKIDTISIESNFSDITIDLLDESILPNPDMIHSIKDIRKLHSLRQQPKSVNVRYTNPDHESSVNDDSSSESDSEIEMKEILNSHFENENKNDSILMNISEEDEPAIKCRKKKHVQFSNENLFNNGEEIRVVKSDRGKQGTKDESLSTFEIVVVNLIRYFALFFYWILAKILQFKTYIYKAASTSYGKGKIHKPTGRPLDEMMLKARMTCPSSQLMSESYNKRLLKANIQKKNENSKMGIEKKNG